MMRDCMPAHAWEGRGAPGGGRHLLIVAEQRVQQLGDGPRDDRAHNHERAYEPGRVGAHLKPVARADRLRDDLACMGTQQ